MIYVKEIKINWNQRYEQKTDECALLSCTDYYEQIAAIRNTRSLELNSPVTFFVGENGSGKSTLLEALAVSYGFNAEGGSTNFQFQSRNTTSDLHEHVTLSRGPVKPKDGFFLRSESLYNLASEIDDLSKEGPSTFLKGYGGLSLHNQSHGESVLSLIKNRFRGNGFYLLDEPEAALSPQRQLTLLLTIMELVREHSQLIIATHSPILLGFPDAAILSFDDSAITPISYEDTESYQVTKMFMENREYLLKKLFDD